MYLRAYSRNLILIACLTLIVSSILVYAKETIADDDVKHILICVTIEDERQVTQMSNLGLSIIGRFDKRVMVMARESHLTVLDSERWQYRILKGYEASHLASASQTTMTALTLNNGKLIVDFNDDGTFTMRRASDGKWLLFPKAETGYFSVNIDGAIYSQSDGTLLVTSALTMTNQLEATITYDVGSNVQVRQIFRLEGDALGLYVSVENDDFFDHHVQVRYLLDTQIYDNDGSPLYAPPLGTRTFETDIPTVNFLNWEAWLTPVNPSLRGFGSLNDIPERMVFAWWPNAFQQVWDYTPDPDQRFYTPGFTTSPESDGCVLLYYDFGTVGSESASSTISTFYGTGPRTAGQPSDDIRQAVEQLRDAVYDYVVGTVDAYAYHSSFALDLVTPDANATDLAISLNQKLTTATTETLGGLVDELASAGVVAGSRGAFHIFLAQLLLVEVDFFLRTNIATLNNIDPNDDPPTIESKILADAYDNTVGWGFEQGLTGINALLGRIRGSGNINIPAELPSTFPVEEFRIAISRLASDIRKAIPSRTRLGQEAFAYWIVPGQSELGSFPRSDYLVGSSSSSLRGLNWQVEQFETLGKIKQAVWYGCTAATVLKVGATAVGIVSGGLPAAAVEGFYWTKVSPVCNSVSFALDALSLQTTRAVHVAHIDATCKVRSDLTQAIQMYENALNEIEAVTNDPTLVDTRYNYSRSVQVSKPAIDDIYLGLGQSVGSGIATIRVTNQSHDKQASALAVMSVPNEVNGQPLMVFHSDIVEISPGASRTLQIPFQAPPNTFFGMNYYFPEITVVSSAGRETKHSFFKVCGGGALGCYLDNVFSILSANLNAGQSVSESASITAGTRRARFVMSYPGSDFDLHLYDQAGNHVGVDYSTGSVDLQIPNALYSGSTTKPEIITIDLPPDAIYRVEVVAVSAETQENCEVILIEEPDHPATILSLPDSVVLAGTQATDTLETVMLFREIGGHNGASNIAFRSTNLVSFNGNVIPSSRVLVDAPISSLQPDSATTAYISIVMPDETPIGEYHGQLTVSSSANQLILPIRASIFSSTIVSLTSVNPAAGKQGETLELTIFGANFHNGATVSFSGTGISVNSVSLVNSSRIKANISIATNAAAGPRDVIVRNPDGQQALGPGVFTVEEACSNQNFNFSDNFQGGNANGWHPVTPSSWRVQQVDGDPANCLVQGNSTGNEYTFLPTSLHDFVLELDAKSTASSNKGYLVVFGADGFNNEPLNHYVLRFLTNGVTLFRVLNGSATELRSVSGDFVGDNRFHRVRVERSLPNIKVSVDGSSLFEVSDASITQGYIGFGVRKRTGCFDNVSVTGTTCSQQAPSLTSFAINNGASSTISRTVTLNNSATNSPAEYQASENSNFSGASWRSYSASPTFTLSSAFGTKVVYLRVRNAGGLSNIRNDAISYEPSAVTIQPVVSSPQPIGGEFWVDISVGSVQNLFGVSFELNFSHTNFIGVVSPTSSSVVPGPFLGSSPVFVSDVDEGNGKVSVGISRKSGQGGVSGDGVVARIKFESHSSTPPSTEVRLSLTNIDALDPSGNSITMNPSDARVSFAGLLVWPGDTNNDGLVNQSDVLPIGLCWAQTGPARNNGSCAWQGQPVTPWSNPNCAYADANGDGVVDQADVLCIGLNWGRTHSLMASSSPTTEPDALALGVQQTASLEVLVDGDPDPGQEFAIDILAKDVTDLFGISFELMYEPQTFLDTLSVVPGDLNFLGSDIIFFPQIDFVTGKVSIGASKKAGQGTVSGSGRIARILARMSPTAVIDQDTTWLSFVNVSANDENGNSIPFTSNVAPLVTAVDERVAENEPQSFALYSNYPNPFNPETTIRYKIAKSTHVRIGIFNLKGQKIVDLVDQDVAHGIHEIGWSGLDRRRSPVASGIYLVRMVAGDFVASRKLLLVR